MADTADSAGTWRTLAETAVLLGLSERTVRRRLAAGQWRTRNEHGHLLVWLPASGGRGVATLADTPAQDATVADSVAADGGQVADSTVAVPMELWREERERASRAEQAAAMWQERARNLEGEIGRLQELLALPAHEEEPAPVRRWWQVWRRSPAVDDQQGRGEPAG